MFILSWGSQHWCANVGHPPAHTTHHFVYARTLSMHLHLTFNYKFNFNWAAYGRKTSKNMNRPVHIFNMNHPSNFSYRKIWTKIWIAPRVLPTRLNGQISSNKIQLLDVFTKKWLIQRFCIRFKKKIHRWKGQELILNPKLKYYIVIM